MDKDRPYKERTNGKENGKEPPRIRRELVMPQRGKWNGQRGCCVSYITIIN
jgi:hypothetical protein